MLADPLRAFDGDRYGLSSRARSMPRLTAHASAFCSANSTCRVLFRQSMGGAGFSRMHVFKSRAPSIGIPTDHYPCVFVPEQSCSSSDSLTGLSSFTARIQPLRTFNMRACQHPHMHATLLDRYALLRGLCSAQLKAPTIRKARRAAWCSIPRPRSPIPEFRDEEGQYCIMQNLGTLG